MTEARPGPPAPSRRRAGLAFGLAALFALSIASFAVGSRNIAFPETLAAILDYDPANDLHLIVVQLRVPRTILAALVGAALGMAGALMQALTRNPLAEPGILGVNAGAAAAVVVGMAAFGTTRITDYVWFAFLGAGLASGAVYLLGRAREAGTNPVRLVLAGAGISMVLGALTTVILINSQDAVYNDFRNWAAGALQGRGYEVLPVIGIAVIAGGALALSVAAPLNAAALGADLGRALGAPLRLVWLGAGAGVLLLAGAATAAAGPIGFVGLVAPHLARFFVGPDYRLVIPFSALFAAVLVLAADVLGRIIAPPSEIAAGIMAALIGGPFFVALVRRRKLARL